MDALIYDLSKVCTQLLPILLSVVLIFLCVLLKKAWMLIDRCNTTIESLNPTIKDVEKSMEKLQAPLDTAVKYSHSLDKVHDKTSQAMVKAASFANENASKLQAAVEEKFKKSEVEKEVEVEEESHE